jgi:cytochrome c553
MRAVMKPQFLAARVAALACLAMGGVGADAAEPVPTRPAQLGLCASCHGEDGRSRQAGTPHLTAQDEVYLRQALRAYRAGERKHAAMQAIAGALTERDIAAMARWYAAQGRAP